MARKIEEQQFGGVWTVEKLEAVESYLNAFTTAMKNQKFTTVYIDAFAGSGTCRVGSKANHLEIEGSALRSILIKNKFDKYFFVEENEENCKELRRICSQYNEVDVDVTKKDCNEFIKDIIQNKNYMSKEKRGVIFLDPFAMSVDWETIEIIGKTGRLDTWYLFPLSAVLRCAAHDPDKVLDEKLIRFFGTDQWKSWYEDQEESRTSDDVLTFCADRMRKVFSTVSEPAILKINNIPYYALFFACSSKSEKANALSQRIAKSILKNYENRKLAHTVRTQIEKNLDKDKLSKQVAKSNSRGQPDLFGEG